MLAPGAQLGPYQIEAPIGAGGMGSVYRAVDTRLGRKVAIKICAQQFSGRFEREARAISALNHPHICTLYDVGPNLPGDGTGRGRDARRAPSKRAAADGRGAALCRRNRRRPGGGSRARHTYTAQADSFAADKPRLWSNTQILDPSGGGPWDLDLAPDGKRFAVFPRPESTGEQRGSIHVTVLLNFFDEVRRRVPASK
jgi:serine/threonine protein kinase